MNRGEPSTTAAISAKGAVERKFLDANDSPSRNGQRLNVQAGFRR